MPSYGLIRTLSRSCRVESKAHERYQLSRPASLASRSYFSIVRLSYINLTKALGASRHPVVTHHHAREIKQVATHRRFAYAR